MALCVYNVLMVRNGIQKNLLALVSQVMNGTDNTVKNHTNVLMGEYGIQYINNASAQRDLIGVDMPAWLFKNAVVDNILILLFKNVCVYQVSNGMVKDVFNAKMQKYGMLQL